MKPAVHQKDCTLKVGAERVFEELGLDMPTAMRLFLKKVVNTRSIPFRVSLGEESDEIVFTEAQIQEILASREELKDPSKLHGPFDTEEANQAFLDSLKRKRKRVPVAV